MAASTNIRLYTHVLFRMSRPLQLLSIALVYLLGGLIAAATGLRIDTTTAILGLIVVLPISASIHFANEYADHETDALTRRTPFSGGSGALPKSGLPARTALIAAWISLGIGSTLAMVAYWLGFLPPTAMGVLAAAAFLGWMYSLPPLKLAWHGWGEMTNATLGGIMLPAYAYAIQTGLVNLQIILACLPFALLAFNNLLTTQWADRIADTQVGKRSLATRWPVRALRLTYSLVAAGSFILLFTLRQIIFPQYVVIFSLLALPVSVWGGITYTKQHSPLPAVAAMVTMLVAQTAGWYRAL